MTDKELSMGQTLASSGGIVWQSFGARALRRFEIRLGMDRLVLAHRRVKRCRGRCRRSQRLARAMLRRLIVLMWTYRDRPDRREAQA